VQAIRDFFYERKFYLVDTPLLTGAIGESAGSLFETEYFDLGKAYLAQTGQLYLEAAAAALGKVYCFGPTFRAEKSKTRRHLAEFWMLEPEVAWNDTNDNRRLQEEFVSYVVARVQLFFIAMSIYYSINFPNSLYISSRGIEISPLRLTLLASAILFVYFIFHHDNLTYLWTAAICLFAALLGPTLPIMWQNLTALMTSSRRLVPKTTLQWGLTSIATSFLLLCCGALLSLKKHLTLHSPTAAIP